MKRWTVTIIILGLLGAAVIAGTLWFVMRPHRAVPAKPKAATSRVNLASMPFSVLLPRDKKTVDTNSIAYSYGILTFKMTHPDLEDPLVVTEQARPREFDFTSFKADKAFATKYGDANVSDFPDRTTGSLVTEKTWIIVNSPSSIGNDKMETILRSLTLK